MKKVANFLGSAIVLAIVVVVYGGSCYRDTVGSYRWDNPYREQAAASGLVVAVEVKSGDLMLPWTWIYPTTYSLAFVDSDSIVRRVPGSDTVFAKLQWVRREDSGKVVHSEHVDAFDCARKQYTAMTDLPADAGVLSAASVPLTGTWSEMSDDMVEAFCT